MDAKPDALAQQEKSSTIRWRGRRLWLASILWITLVALSLVVLIASIPPGFQKYSALAQNPDFRKLGLSPSLVAVYLVSVEVIFALGSVTLSALIFWRSSGNWMAIFVSLIGAVFGATNNPLVYNLHARDPAWHFPIALLVYSSQFSGIIGCYVFPDGRFVPRWSRVPAIAIATWMLISVPFPRAPFSPERLPFSFLSLFLFGCASTAMYAQVYRYKRVSTALQRQQTKWVVFGMMIGIVGYMGDVILPLALPLLYQPGNLRAVYAIAIGPAFRLSMLAAPLTIAISILRYHLWDIDFVINRSLVYSALTVLLGSVFAAGFFALRAFMQAVFQARQDLIAVAIPAVVITALFTPTRKALRRFVDQRIYGIQLDYEEVADDRAVKHLQSPLDPKISFGIYKDMELVGRGGMSEVYCAYHPILKRRVAIKILSKNLLLDEIARKRFDHEAQAISMLSHPNIVTCYEYNEHDGVPYMVLEFLEGQALSQIIRKSGRLPLNEALPILRDVASALDFAHAHGIIHRDVKPSNVIVEQKQAAAGGQNQRAVLTDFGIAKLYNVTHLTSTGNMLGSLDYVSPEQIRGAGEADLRSDIYSFGVMAYEMLTGTLPFGHGNPGALVMAHLLTPPPDPRTKIPDLPAPAAEALLRAMAKDPQSRQKTVQDLVMALEQCEQIQHTASMQATEVLGDVVRNHL